MDFEDILTTFLILIAIACGVTTFVVFITLPNTESVNVHTLDDICKEWLGNEEAIYFSELFTTQIKCRIGDEIYAVPMRGE